VLPEDSRGRGFKGSRTTVDYIRMLYISYSSVYELDTAKKDLAEIERMLKALIKT
jgi:hypothetical protein